MCISKMENVLDKLLEVDFLNVVPTEGLDAFFMTFHLYLRHVFGLVSLFVCRQDYRKSPLLLS